MAGCCLKLFAIITLVLAILFGIVWQKINTVPDIPDIKSQYWGPGEPKPDDKSIRPFKINVSEDVLIDLKTRLKNTRLVKPLEGVEFQYGMNTDYLKKILEFWQTKYDWKKREVYLNKFPQFKTQISGLDIHFLHIKPDAKKAEGKQILPLLLLHGWPGSIREFYEIIPLLMTPRLEHDYAFELIVPSLPGYGFSDGSSKPGLAPANIAIIFKELLLRLQFNNFYVHGGDWGSNIAAMLAILYPENVIGFHSNSCSSFSTKALIMASFANFFPILFNKEKFVSFSDTSNEGGYLHLHASKPDTIGVSLTDSPVGLAAYILEKFSTWTNRAWRDMPNGGLENYDQNALLDNVMIYWITHSITTSVRLYSEFFSKNYMDYKLREIPVKVPAGCARFQNDIIYPIRSIIKNHYTNLITLSDYKLGGHFAAFEIPDILANDIWLFVDKQRSIKIN